MREGGKKGGWDSTITGLIRLSWVFPPSHAHVGESLGTRLLYVHVCIHLYMYMHVHACD